MSLNPHSIKRIDDLLIAALNKNQVTFSQIAKIAEELSSGNLKMKLDSSGKMVIIQYLNKKVTIELNTLRLNGFKYLNNILIDDILTKGELDDIYKTLEEVQEALLNKADKEHTHNAADIVDLQTALEDKADKEHTHEISDVNGLQDELNNKADKDHTHKISDVNGLEEKFANIKSIPVLTSNTDLNSVNNMIKQTPLRAVSIGYCPSASGDFGAYTFLAVHPATAPRTFTLAVPKSYSGYIQLQQQSSPDGSAYENINWYKIPVCNASNYLSLPGGLTVNGDATVSNSLTVNGNLNGHDIRLMSALKLLLQNSTPLFSNRSQCQEYKNLVYQLGLTPFAGSPSEVWVGDYRAYM